MQKKRAHNGLVLLAGGGRKVQPIEIEVAKNIFALILLSLEFPMQTTSPEAILEIASDLARKQHRDPRYCGIAQGIRNCRGRGYSKPNLKESFIERVQKHFVDADAQAHEPTSVDRMEVDKVLRAGGF